MGRTLILSGGNSQWQVKAADGPHEFLFLDEQFHHRLASAAGQSHIWKILKPLKSQIDRIRYLNVQHFPRDELLAQHSQIVEAIRARDPNAAEKAMRRHMRQILLDLPVIWDALPELIESSPAGSARKLE